MKNLSLVVVLFYTPFVWASEACKLQAQRSVEIREDYKNLAELLDSVEVGIAKLGGLTGERRARYEHELKLLLIDGEAVFLHSKNLKGPKLHKLVYEKCVAYEKRVSDREARQAAREAAK